MGWPPGFEPGPTASQADMLPLHYSHHIKNLPVYPVDYYDGLVVLQIFSYYSGLSGKTGELDTRYSITGPLLQ